MRPDWQTYHLRACYLAATRATCPRKHVGAILVSDDQRVVATGYNGAPHHMPSCDEVGCDIVEGHCLRSIHAEANALLYAGRAARGCTLYVSVTPCWDCAKLIVNAQISRVVFAEAYSSRYGKSDQVPSYLRAGGVAMEQFASPGLDLFKQHLVEMERHERIVAETTQVEWACGCSAPASTAPEFCPEHHKARTHE